MIGQRAADYSSESLEKIRATCLSIAQILGDDILPLVSIVGGFVPSIIFGDAAAHPSLGLHVGTLDLDLGLDLAVLDDERYEDIAERLRSNGFMPDRKESDGPITRQRWRSKFGTTVDFVIAPVPPDEMGGKIQSLTADLAAITMLGMDLALEHRTEVALAGNDLSKRSVTRVLPVCRLEVFVVLKALAMAGRDKAKDAYDLYFVLLNCAEGPDAVGAWLSKLSDHPAVKRAVDVLRRDFASVDGRGPKDVCNFLGDDDIDRAANVYAQVLTLLRGFDTATESPTV